MTTFATQYESKNAEIIALFVAAGKEIPTKDSNTGIAIQILQRICDSQNHTIPKPGNGYNDADLQAENESIGSDIFDAIDAIESDIGDDFSLDFDGNEYRLIAEDAIWEIYRDEIQQTVKSCYDFNLDEMPPFVAFEIDWEQTAKNCYADGYGHTFSGYDGSEEEIAGYYIFRTN
jgi:hypothetical protein